MWQINGQGDNKVKLFDICRPVLLQCSIKGGKTVNPATGRHLHGLYVIDFGKVRPAIVGLGGDEHDGSMKVRFDLNGPTHLNMPGSLYLTDGNPAMLYDVCTSVCECVEYTPSWHPLIARVTGNYLIPEYHSRIRTVWPPVQFNLGNMSGQLDHIPIPLTGDDDLFLATSPATIVTEWWG